MALKHHTRLMSSSHDPLGEKAKERTSVLRRYKLNVRHSEKRTLSKKKVNLKVLTLSSFNAKCSPFLNLGKVCSAKNKQINIVIIKVS